MGIRTVNRFIVVSALVFTACPERATPDHGIVLTYEKGENSDDVRATVDRRLAALKVKASLQEDSTTLTIRVPNGEGVELVKKTLSRRARLEFCAEDEALAKKLCTLERATAIDSLCAVIAPTKEGVETLVKSVDTNARVGIEDAHGEFVAYALEKSCFAPRIVATRAITSPYPAVSLDFDKSSAKQFGELTTKLVGKRLIIWLDGEVASAPRVVEPITGGSAMLTVGQTGMSTKEELESLGAALMGGALPPMSLKSETAYGPPTLFKR